MASEVLINVAPSETRVAIVEEARLRELFIERTMQPGDAVRAGRSGHRLLGNIMLGRVQRVLPGMQAAFVDLGLEKAGFLAAREARCLSDLPSFMDQPCITKCVREGEAVVVQVIVSIVESKRHRCGILPTRRATGKRHEARETHLCVRTWWRAIQSVDQWGFPRRGEVLEGVEISPTFASFAPSR